MDHPDDRLRAFIHFGKHLGQVAGVFEVFLVAEINRLFHPVQITPGAEGGTFAAENHGSNLWLGNLVAENAT